MLGFQNKKSQLLAKYKNFPNKKRKEPAKPNLHLLRSSSNRKQCICKLKKRKSQSLSRLRDFKARR
jgi:hypothetical protein